MIIRNENKELSKRQVSDNIVIAEIHEEIKTAFKIVEIIRNRLTLNWKNVQSIVEDTTVGWSGLGTIIDLGFLSV